MTMDTLGPLPARCENLGELRAPSSSAQKRLGSPLNQNRSGGTIAVQLRLRAFQIKLHNFPTTTSLASLT